MKWRTVPIVLAGLLLPLPLIWVSHLVLSGSEVQSPPSRGPHAVRMLSKDERLRLRTYEQFCEADADCESPLRCFYNMRTQRQYCADSTCATNDDCAKDFACRTLRSADGKGLLRACSLEGLRKEGELCDELPSKREDGCGKGLLCNGFCGRGCRLDAPGSCPPGHVCKEGDNGPSCEPTCEGRACPVGQRCVTSLLGGLGSVCMTVYGQDCEVNACASGLECNSTTFKMAPGKIWMECLAMCARTEPRCTEGKVCALFQCHQGCEPGEPSGCEPGFTCLRHEEGQPWACMPDSAAR